MTCARHNGAQPSELNLLIRLATSRCTCQSRSHGRARVSRAFVNGTSTLLTRAGLRSSFRLSQPLGISQCSVARFEAIPVARPAVRLVKSTAFGNKSRKGNWLKTFWHAWCRLLNPGVLGFRDLGELETEELDQLALVGGHSTNTNLV